MVTVHDKDGDSCSLKMLKGHQNDNESSVSVDLNEQKSNDKNLTKINKHFPQKTKTKSTNNEHSLDVAGRTGLFRAYSGLNSSATLRCHDTLTKVHIWKLSSCFV